MGLGLSLGLSLGSRGGASTAAWYLSGKADNTDPSFWADFENNRYAVNGSEESFSDIFTFTRSTTGTRVNSSGLIETVAIDQPRFDYDPVTHAPKGILIEEQRTNLLTRSSEFDNVYWAKSNVSITADSSIAPDGSNNADKIVENTSNSSHLISVDAGLGTAGNYYTFTIFAKAELRNKGFLAFSHYGAYSGGNPEIKFDLSSGTITSTGTTSRASIINIGNGWYEISMTAQMTTADNVYPVFAIRNLSGASAYTGDGTSGIYIWGAQLEVGSFPTSYIPTTTAAVTRSADSVANTGSNTVPFSSWYNSSAGTVYTDFNYYGSDNSFPRIFDINDTVSNSNMISLLQDTSAQQASYNIYSSSVYQGMSIGAPDLRGSRRKFAGTVALNNAAAVINGGALSTDTSLAMPISLVRMDIGNAHTGTRGACLHIRELRYYPIRVSNASLQELTS